VSDLHESFIEGQLADRSGVAGGMLGIGLNAQQIAQHFSVTPAVISRLLDSTVTAGEAPPVER
jgi:hypothetical protein